MGDLKTFKNVINPLSGLTTPLYLVLASPLEYIDSNKYHLGRTMNLKKNRGTLENYQPRFLFRPCMCCGLAASTEQNTHSGQACCVLSL